MKNKFLLLVPHCGWHCGAAFHQERALASDKTTLIETDAWPRANCRLSTASGKMK